MKQSNENFNKFPLQKNKVQFNQNIESSLKMFESFLVLSNTIILPTIFTLFPHNWLECFTYAMVFLTSTTYHLAILNQWSHFYPLLWKWDHIWALQSISTCLLYFLPNRIMKRTIWLIQFISHIILIYHSPQWMNFHILLTSLCFLYLYSMEYHIHTWYDLQQFWNYEIHQLSFLLTMSSVLSGWIFFHLAIDEPNEYPIFHSLWHICIFSSTYTSLSIPLRKRIHIHTHLERNISMENFARTPRGFATGLHNRTVSA